MFIKTNVPGGSGVGACRETPGDSGSHGGARVPKGDVEQYNGPPDVTACPSALNNAVALLMLLLVRLPAPRSENLHLNSVTPHWAARNRP